MKILKVAGLIFGFVFVASAAFAGWVFWQIPSEKQIRGCMVTKMAQVNLCPGSKGYTPIQRISPFLQKAVVMSEDASFWQHRGFDWDELQKSFETNLAAGSYRRGGSTITQQLAKNLFLTKDKTLTRKGIEAIITYRIERTLSKKEILERYLNVVEFGRNIYGVQAAARHYFGKSPSQLDPVESAFLAMLLPNPIKYSSSHQKKNLTDFGRRRVQRILTDMMKTGKMTQDQYQEALARMDRFLNPEAEAAHEELQGILSLFQSAEELASDPADRDQGEGPGQNQDQQDVGEAFPSEANPQKIPNSGDSVSEGEEPGRMPETGRELIDGEIDSTQQ